MGEHFFDFNSSGSYDAPDGFYNGLLCSDTGGRCSPVSDTTGIGQQNLIIMSGSSAVIAAELQGNPGVPITSVDLTGGAQTVVFRIGDTRNQPMPAETTIALETTNGEIIGPSSFSQSCTASAAPLAYSFTLSPDDEPDSGIAFLTVTTPGGIISTLNLSVGD